jgi:TonB family protein
MIATVKVDETPAELYVKKFRSLCDMHSVRFGSADSFSAFMQRLVEDRKFAMDFWALAGQFSSREGGQLSDQQMLEVIIHEIAGSSAAAVDDSLKPQISDLTRLFAGEDIQSPIVQDDVVEEGPAVPSAAVIPPPFQPTPSTPQIPPLESARKTVEPAPAASAIPVSKPVPVSDKRIEDRIPEAMVDRGLQPEPGALTQHQLDEALLRLELNSLELKLHLDNIDSRMSRMEPHLEELAQKVSVARERMPVQQIREPVREQPRETMRPFQESVGRAVEKSRLVLEPQPVPVRSTVDDDDTSIAIPLEDYSQRRFSRSAGLFAALLLVGAGVFFFLHRQYGASMWQDFGPSLREKYDAARQELRDVMKGHTSNGSDSASSSSDVAAANAGQAQPAPIVSQSAPIANPPEPSPIPPSEPVTEPQAASLKSGAHTNHKSRVTAPTERELASSDSAFFSSDSEGPVSVAPAVMEENLVMSRVPAYPDVARADHIEGPVVMQAIISKNGTVGHLHVIQGDPLLRSAASEAVSKWRYRPYTVNGKPVEVATTVTVDFKLNR